MPLLPCLPIRLRISLDISQSIYLRDRRFGLPLLYRYCLVFPLVSVHLSTLLCLMAILVRYCCAAAAKFPRLSPYLSIHISACRSHLSACVIAALVYRCYVVYPLISLHVSPLICLCDRRFGLLWLKPFMSGSSSAMAWVLEYPGTGMD